MFRNKHFFFSMVLEKVSLKQNREHWLHIPYGVERRVCVELKSVKIIMVYNLCFHFNSNNLFTFFSIFFQVAWLISLVFVMHLVALFCHSNDIFIGAHIETIEKFKKCMFRIMNMSLTLILRWKLCYLGLASISMMRCGIYEDAMKEYALGPNNEILHRVLLYHTVSWISMLDPNASVITVGSRLTI